MNFITRSSNFTFIRGQSKWPLLHSARCLSARVTPDFQTRRREPVKLFDKGSKVIRSPFVDGTAFRASELQKTGKNSHVHHRSEQRRWLKDLPDRPLSVEEWRELRESMGPLPVDSFPMRALKDLMEAEADLTIVKSLLSYVASDSGSVSYALLLRYLVLCVYNRHHDEVLDLYHIMRRSFPNLEYGAYGLFIRAFAEMSMWREAMELLQELKKIHPPRSKSYCEIIEASASKGELEIAWSLHAEMLDLGLEPRQETLEALFKAGEPQERLLGTLHHMIEDITFPQKPLAATIKTWFESLPGHRWRGHWTNIKPDGECSCCGRSLESIRLDHHEYQLLKKSIMADVIQGSDVFRKTNPKELEQFKRFVAKAPPFDLVVDGLNIGIQMRRMEINLCTMVSDLRKKNLNILVLGRKHMKREHKWGNMERLQREAHCFFTENDSEDDPYLLYATIHSGNHCRFLSTDLMRDHKAAFKDRLTKRLFFKWQRGHQMVLDKSRLRARQVVCERVLGYDTVVQTTGDSWHIPYSSEERRTWEVPGKWLCLSKR